MKINTKKYESESRVLIDKILIKNEWILDKTQKNKNVYTKSPKYEKERLLLNIKRPDYILYDNNHKIISIIECKKEGWNLEKSFNQVEEYAKLLKFKGVVFVSDGFITISKHLKFDQKIQENNVEIMDIPTLKKLILFKDLYNLKTINKEIIKNRNELIKLFGQANNILRKDGIKNGEGRFNEFSNILFIKIFSEMESQKKENEREFKDDKYLWDYIFNRDETEKTNLEYINNDVIPHFSKIYGLNIFKKSKIKDNNILKEIMESLNKLSLIDLNSDLKGDAFEYFLRSYNTNYSDLGQYFTPRNIIDLMVKILNPKLKNKKGEYLKTYDPFCGTGGMLISVFQHILNNNIINKDDMQKLRRETLYGSEISDTVTTAKKNMILYGDGHTNIKQQDTLKNKVIEKYDYCITNIPFSQNTDYGKEYEIAGNQADPVCIQHCIKSLKNKGKGAVIVPEGALYSIKNGIKSRNRRKWLNEVTFDLIVPLPRGIFRPYAKDVKTYILFFTKEKPIKEYSIPYFEIFNDGFELNTSRRKIVGKNDIDDLLFEYNRKNISEDIIKIPIKIIKENNNILTLSFYNKYYLKENDLYFKDIFNIYSVKNRGLSFSLKDVSSIDKLGFCRKTAEKFEYNNSSDDLSNYKILKNNDFVFRPTADKRIIFNINKLKNDVIVSQLYLTLTNKTKIPNEVLFYTLNKSTKLQDVLKRIGFGTARPSLNQNLLLNIPITIPAKNEWAEIKDWFYTYKKEVKNIREWNKDWKIK